MAGTTSIEWADATWNPTVGCTKVSPGCDNCYAETLVNRFAGHNKGFPNRFDVMTLRGEDHLTLPLRWQKPKRIFVNSLSDLFHQDVPDEFIARVFAVMALAPRHTFQLLTKRHGRMRALLNSELFRRQMYDALVALDYAWINANQVAWPLTNVWLGVSVEDQKRADLRIPALLDTPAAVRFLSCEPLLGPITFRWAKWQPFSDDPNVWNNELDGLRRLDWVIVGGESGPGARPMRPDWARSIRDQCQAAGVPFLFKQWGNWVEVEGEARLSDRWVNPDGSQVEVVSATAANVHRGAVVMRNVGKKAAGRVLDGRTWDEYPGVTR